MSSHHVARHPTETLRRPFDIVWICWWWSPQLTVDLRKHSLIDSCVAIKSRFKGSQGNRPGNYGPRRVSWPVAFVSLFCHVLSSFMWILCFQNCIVRSCFILFHQVLPDLSPWVAAGRVLSCVQLANTQGVADGDRKTHRIFWANKQRFDAHLGRSPDKKSIYWHVCHLSSLGVSFQGSYLLFQS